MSLQTVVGGVALACVAGRAEAADPRLRVHIPQRSYAEALIDLALQANVSILGTAACGPGGQVELSGRFTLKEALDRLLAGAPCDYRVVDAGTVRITRLRPRLRDEPEAPAEQPPPLVSEVVITATKRPVALERLPAGASVLPRDQIEATGATDVSGAVGQLAGMLTTNLGPGRNKLLVRGVSDGAFTGRTRSTVSTYLDDAPINYNAPDPDLRLVDVDRLEALRGPQGALYGSGSIGGVYRIVTRKPDLQQPEMGASASLATTRGGSTSRALDGYLSVPVIKDHLGVRLVAYDEVQGGYLDDVNLRITNVDQTRRSGGRLAVRVRFDSHWSLDTLAASQHLRSDDTQYVTAAMTSSPRSLAIAAEAGASGGTGGAPDDRRNRVQETHNNDFSYAGATLTGEFSWGAVTSSTSYVHHVFSSQYEGTDAGLNFPAIATDLGVYFEKARINLLVEDVVVRSAGAGPFQWLLGVYGARSLEKSPSTLDFLAPGSSATAYDENRKNRLFEYALYGEGSYQLGDGWTVTVGGRAFESRVHTTADLTISSPFGPRTFDGRRNSKGFSPKITLQREFANGDLVYALVSEGFRPGGLNTSGFQPIRSTRVDFAPDRLRNYELGAKFRRLDNRLSVRVAAYYDDWSNIQSDRYRPSGLAYTANVGDARILGLEGEVGYDLPFGLSLRLNGLLTDSKVRHPNPDFDQPVTPELPGAPKTSGGLLVVYRRPIGSALTLRLIGEGSYVGRSVLSFDSTASPPMGHYLRARLSAELSNQTWRLAAYVSNPLDDSSDTFAYGNPFSFGSVRQLTPQRPRTVGVRLSAAF
ncbi:TonB-dependent receptor [Phenylobacterium sp.]|uniref:TonB-dependent receptor domain-containing protein n=1 Tax=Phenylobacterium sp. TaxID=1871053 RepID=UPI0025EDCE2B|nr:TonB-dependent receptor [Phenylobacterium sp.]